MQPLNQTSQIPNSFYSKLEKIELLLTLDTEMLSA